MLIKTQGHVKFHFCNSSNIRCLVYNHTIHIAISFPSYGTYYYHLSTHIRSAILSHFWPPFSPLSDYVNKRILPLHAAVSFYHLTPPPRLDSENSCLLRCKSSKDVKHLTNHNEFNFFFRRRKVLLKSTKKIIHR